MGLSITVNFYSHTGVVFSISIFSPGLRENGAAKDVTVCAKQELYHAIKGKNSNFFFSSNPECY